MMFRSLSTMPSLFAHLSLATLAINLLGLALPLMTLQIYDRVLTHHGESTLAALTFGVLLAAAMECTLRIMRSSLSGWAGAQFEHRLTVRSLASLTNARLSEAQRKDAGECVQDMAAVGRLREYYGGQMFYALVDVPFVLLFLGLIAYLAGALVMIPLVLLALFMGTALWQGARLKQAMRARDFNDNRRLSFTIDALSHIHTAKALALEAPLVRRFEQLQSHAGITNYRVTRTTGAIGNVGYFFAQAMMVLMVTAGAPLAVEGKITTGTLIACVLLSGRIMQPLQKGLGVWVRMQDIALAKERIDKLLSLTPEKQRGKAAFRENEGSLRCLDMTFRHDPDHPLLEEINLTLSPGDVIAITGGRSTGKTTLLELMSGLNQPGAGRLLINGQEASHYTAEDLLRQVGYMPTQGILFRGTILDNLTGFRPDRVEEAMEASRQLGIDEAVKRMPSGYDTQLETAAADIVPPGVRQRIALARVLAARPHILLFDNADRALDRDGYNHLFTLLGKLKGKVTLVLVSDDRNILSLADQIYELRDGKLAMQFLQHRRFDDQRRILKEVGL